MSFLGDAFPEEYKSKFAERNLAVGTVIRLYVTDTTPHKHKYFVIVGFSGDKVALGVVYINTEINPFLFDSEELKKLHIPISPDSRELVEHDCFIDCSDIKQKRTDLLRAAIEEQPEAVKGQLNEQELRQVQLTLFNATTINDRTKAKFGYK